MIGGGGGEGGGNSSDMTAMELIVQCCGMSVDTLLGTVGVVIMVRLIESRDPGQLSAVISTTWQRKASLLGAILLVGGAVVFSVG